MSVEINWLLVGGIVMMLSGLGAVAVQMIRKHLPAVSSDVQWVQEICEVSKAVPAEKTLDFLKAGLTRTQALEAVVEYLTKGSE